MISPHFSIIIPTYNRGVQLENTVRSVLNQQEKNFELIIIDDGSTDATELVMGKFLPSEKIKYLKQANRERGAARNTGAMLARGEFLNFFDSDDEMYENHLHAATEFVKTHDNAKFFILVTTLLTKEVLSSLPSWERMTSMLKRG